jgi:hypothetical protein
MIRKDDLKLHKVEAILIGKKVSNKKTEEAAINSLFRMKRGLIDNLNDDNLPKRFYLEFMTESGPLGFVVSNKVYYAIKLNSMGILEYTKRGFKDFIFKKIATKEDVEELGW